MRAAAGWSRGTRCRSRRTAARRGTRRGSGRSASSAAGWCKRRELDQRAQLGERRRSSTSAAARSVAAVHDAVGTTSTSVGRGARAAPAIVERSRPPVIDRARHLDRRRAGVDDEQRAPVSRSRSSRRPRRCPRRARASTPAPGAGRRPCPGAARPRASRARGPVDHVDDQVVAVEVVEHHHVERRGGRAVLLEPVHVQAVVVAAPVGEPVDQPRVAVEGEDHRPVLGEEGVELAVGQPVRVLVVGQQPHEVDDVDDADAQVGQLRCAGSTPPPASRGSGRRPRRRARRRARVRPASVPAHSQMPRPRAQCAIGVRRPTASRGCGCLPATTTFT